MIKQEWCSNCRDYYDKELPECDYCKPTDLEVENKRLRKALEEIALKAKRNNVLSHVYIKKIIKEALK